MDDRRSLLAEVLLQVHDAMLPRGLPVPQGADVAARYLLAEEYTGSGGDWFDAIPLPDGRLVVVVGDVVGHGVQASLVMGELKAVFEEEVRGSSDPVAALEILDARAGRVHEARSTTLCVAVLDPVTGELEYCTAGHPPPVLVTAAGEASYLPATGAGPLQSGKPFRTATRVLDPGDLLLLYSDGLVERPGSSPGENTVDLLRVAAGVARGSGPDEPTAERVCRLTLELLVRRSGYDDDITVLAVQLVPRVDPLALRLPAVPDAVRTVRADLDDWLDDLRVSPIDRTAVQHAVGELVSNAVEHAYDEVDVGHPVSVDLSLTHDGVVALAVADEGQWREPAADATGRGLAMASGFLDHFDLEHDREGTRASGRHHITHPASLLRGTAVYPAEPRASTYALGVEGDVVHVAGALDLRCADDLRAGIARASLGGARSVTVDLVEVDVLCSAAVQALYDARAAGPVDLVAPMGSAAQHVLEIVQLPYRG